MRWLSEKSRIITAIALLLFGSVVIFQGLALALNRSLVLDEAVTVMHSYAAVRGVFSELFADIHMPVYNVLVAGWMAVFGFDVFVAKTFSILCALLALVVTFAFGDRFFDRRTALLSSFLLSFSPIFIQYSQYARSYGLFIALAALSSYFYLGFSRDGFRLRSRAAALYVIATFLLLTTHMVGVALLGVQFVHSGLLARRARDGARFARWLASGAVIAALYVPVVWIIFHRYDLLNDIPIIYSWVKLPDVGDLFQSVGYSIRDSIYTALFFPIFIAIALWRRGEKSDVVTYLILWLGIPSLILFIGSHVFHPVFIRRGLVPSLVPLVLLASFGIVRARRFAVVGFACAIGISLWGADEIAERREKEEEAWSAVASTIRESPRSPAATAIFIRPGFAWPALMYYLDRDCFLSMEPKACLSKHSVSLMGEGSLTGPLNRRAVNWYVGYFVEDTTNSRMVEEVKSDARFSGFQSYPGIRGVDLFKFEIKTPPSP